LLPTLLDSDGHACKRVGHRYVDNLYVAEQIVDALTVGGACGESGLYQLESVTYKEEYEEHPNTDYTDDNKHKDKYKDIGTAKLRLGSMAARRHVSGNLLHHL